VARRKTHIRVTVHALFAAAMVLALLLVACGSSVAQTRWESPGQAYAQKVISVDRSRELELMTFSGKTHSSASWLWWLTGGIALSVMHSAASE
jgi:hypothetical protein